MSKRGLQRYYVFAGIYLLLGSLYFLLHTIRPAHRFPLASRHALWHQSYESWNLASAALSDAGRFMLATHDGNIKLYAPDGSLLS